MRKLGRQVVLVMLLLASFGAQTYAKGGVNKNKKNGVKKNEAGIKKPFEFHMADGVLTIGGKSVTEHRFQKNAVLLNKNIPDETDHFRQTVEANLHFEYGEKKFDHKAIEMGTIFRFKTIWGQIGYMAGTDRAGEHKIVDALVGAHSHPSTRSLLWVKEAWLQASWNAIFGIKSEKLHTIKGGMFPFTLGRGIALGPFYGVTKDFLAIYSRDTDYSAPGILFSGEILRDVLWYDLYYAKLEDKSASFSDVFNSEKEHWLGRRSKPWRGSSKDSDLFAARLKVKPFDNKGMGVLELEPYIFFNEASDQEVEVPTDSKSKLGALGMAAEYKNGNFECGGEVAFNYGEEKLWAIDRNIVMLKNDKYGDDSVECIHQVYSKVLYNDTANYEGKNVIVNATTESAVANNRRLSVECANHCTVCCQQNDAVWTPDPVDPNGVAQYKNVVDRYRCPYTNKYRGWMAVVDASYLFESINLKMALGYGYASGDANPHTRECDKNYDGFVGLYELYNGKRVPSVFVLDARKIRRPLTLDANTGNVTETDNSFTDIQYFGGGLTWEPKCLKKYKSSFNANVLGFWKVHDSLKYDCCANEGEGGVADCSCGCASSYLGTEFNLICECELLKDLTIASYFAIFWPGSYYGDVKGAPMSGDLFNQLEEADRADLPSSRYRLCDDTAYYTQLVVTYKF